MAYEARCMHRLSASRSATSLAAFEMFKAGVVFRGNRFHLELSVLVRKNQALSRESGGSTGQDLMLDPLTPAAISNYQ